MRGDVSGAMIDAPAGVLLALPGHVVDDWRLGKEVIGNFFQVAVGEIFETIVDGLPHRALDLALLGRNAGSQELDNVILFPFADPGIGVRRYVGDELTVGPIRRPGQPLTGSRGAEEITRSMALAAMRERGDKVSSAIVGDRAIGGGLERTRGKEQQLPTGLQEAPGEWEGHVVRPVLPVYWGKREQIGLDRQSVAVGDAGEARIWEHWEIVRSVGPHAFAECTQKLRVGPAADAGFRIGCDIRTVEGAKRGSERPASSQLLSAGNGMAREAPAGSHEIFAARHRVFPGFCRDCSI